MSERIQFTYFPYPLSLSLVFFVHCTHSQRHLLRLSVACRYLTLTPLNQPWHLPRTTDVTLILFVSNAGHAYMKEFSPLFARALLLFRLSNAKLAKELEIRET